MLIVVKHMNFVVLQNENMQYFRTDLNIGLTILLLVIMDVLQSFNLSSVASVPLNTTGNKQHKLTSLM